MAKQERFYLPGRELRVQTDNGSRSITGLVPYGAASTGLPWLERISKGAFASALKPGAETVLLLRQHDVGLVFGNTDAKTLILKDSPEGLRFHCPALPNTTAASDLIESMQRGDIDGVSIGMIVTSDEWSENSNGQVTRNILALDLFEISIVNFAVYKDAQASLRSVPKAFRALLKRSHEAGCECSCGPCNEDDCSSCEGEDGDGSCEDEACLSHGCPLQDGDDEDRSQPLTWSERTLLRLEVMRRL